MRVSGALNLLSAGNGRLKHAANRTMSTTTDETRHSIAPARGLAAALDYACASHKRAAVLLIAFALIAFLPGFFQIPPVDRDEAHFAQATKQMLETGEYVDIHFQDEVRYKKPVGIYWLQAAAVKAGEALGVPGARTTIWLYRLPSLFGAIGAVLLTYWAALAFVARRAALVAALMMASSILLGVEARLAKTDAVLLMTCVAAMGAMARIYLSRRRTPDEPIGWRDQAVLWTALAGGVLIKGPLILMFVGPHRAHVVDCRPLAALARRAAAARRHRLADSAGAAVVRGDRRQVRRQFLRAGRRPRHAGQGHQRRRRRMARRRAIICCCSGSRSGPARCWRGSPCRWSGRRGASRARNSCSPGWCRPGSCSKR